MESPECSSNDRHHGRFAVALPGAAGSRSPAAGITKARSKFTVEHQHAAINPTIVFEVFSETTERYDRGKKAENDRQLESLKAYTLVSQSSPHIEIYEHHSDGFWFLTEAKGLDQEIAIKCLGIKLPFAEVYDRVKFGKKK